MLVCVSKRNKYESKRKRFCICGNYCSLHGIIDYISNVPAGIVAEEVEEEDEELLLDDERALRGLLEESGEEGREDCA